MSDNRPKSRQHPEALRNVALRQIYVYALIRRFPLLMTVWPQRSAWRALLYTRWDTIAEYVFKCSAQNQVSIEMGSGLGRVFLQQFPKEKTSPGKFSHETYYLVHVLKKKNKVKSKRKVVFYGNSKTILKLLFLDVFLSLEFTHTWKWKFKNLKISMRFGLSSACKQCFRSQIL